MQLKTISDYYEQVHEKFPELDIQDIKKILNFGWKSLYLHNSYGGDTIVKDNNFWCYIGKLTNDSFKHFDYYAQKLALKIRILYKRNKIPWDGNYYFALTDSQYEDYLSQQSKRGRKRKYYTFKKVFLYKILDECSLKNCYSKYIFKLPLGVDLGYKYYKPELKTSDSELIITREPLKFKDILVSNNNFETL